LKYLTLLIQKEVEMFYNRKKEVKKLNERYDENRSQLDKIRQYWQGEIEIDLAGNVREWCFDWFDSNYYQSCVRQSLIKDPRGPEKGNLRVLRGGSYDLNKCYIRCVCRDWLNPSVRLRDVGF